MRFQYALFLLTIMYSCQSEHEEKEDQYLYTGIVVSYEEDEGEEGDFFENLLVEGVPIEGVEIEFFNSGTSYPTGCCWGQSTGDVRVCNTTSDEFGVFECNMINQGYSISTSNIDNFTRSRLMGNSNETRRIMTYKTTPVIITLKEYNNAETVRWQAHRSNFLSASRTMNSSEGGQFSSWKQYRDTLHVMENMNITFHISKNGGESEQFSFFTGNKDDLRNFTHEF